MSINQPGIGGGIPQQITVTLPDGSQQSVGITIPIVCLVDASGRMGFLPVATAASTSARTVVGAIVILSHALAIGDMAVGNFGGVEGFVGTAGAIGGAGLPPVIIGPGQCALINFLILTQSAASSWTPELNWWER